MSPEREEISAIAQTIERDLLTVWLHIKRAVKDAGSSVRFRQSIFLFSTFDWFLLSLGVLLYDQHDRQMITTEKLEQTMLSLGRSAGNLVHNAAEQWRNHASPAAKLELQMSAQLVAAIIEDHKDIAHVLDEQRIALVFDDLKDQAQRAIDQELML